MEKTRTKTVSMAAFLCRGCVLAPLLLLLLGARVLAVCPSACSCSRGHRDVDCSGRGLSQLPEGLQHNIRSLNLSHNHLQELDGLLAHFTHLRSLDVSQNHLHKFPSGLPRALWDIWASRNRLRQLDKNDTAYHWNLRTLDVSWNELDRVVFINNTLPALLKLNLSHNKFRTVPTNMPVKLEMVDISHNYLRQIIPGSLDRLTRLQKFYLHGNRFVWLGGGVFGHLGELTLLTLGDNPWACDEEENITSLLLWLQQTHARVLGCPCHTHHTCGEAHLGTAGSWLSHASYTEAPGGAEAHSRLLRVPGNISGPSMQAVTSGYLSKWALVNSPQRVDGNLSAEVSERTVPRDTRTSTVPEVTTHHGLRTKTSTVVSTQRSKKVSPVRARSTSLGLHATISQSISHSLFIAVAVLKGF